MSNYRLIKTSQDVTVVIDIPGAVAASDICVELLDSNTLAIAVPSLGGYQLTIPLPLSTSQDGCTVRFKKKSRQLSVKLVHVEQTLFASGVETTEYVAEKSREAQGLSDCSTKERSAITTAEQSYAAAQAVCDTSVAASAFTSVEAVADAKYGARKSYARNQAIKSLAAALELRGWAVCDEFIPRSRVMKIREELGELQRAGLYDTGRVGPSSTGRHEMATLRGDKVLWLDAAGLAMHPNLRVLSQDMDELIEKELCGRVARLQNLEGRTDAMLTNYPGKGARYVKHVDNTHADGRVLTAIVYLNEATWSNANGGVLRLHPMGTQLMTAAGFGQKGTNLPKAFTTPAKTWAVDVQPIGGRLVLFYADLMLHEVRLCFGAIIFDLPKGTRPSKWAT